MKKYKSIIEIEKKLDNYNRVATLFDEMRNGLISDHGIDVCNGDTDYNTTSCKYAIIYALKLQGVSNLFIQELLGYSVPSTVSTAHKKARFYFKTQDELFMKWWHIIKDLTK